jgi:hypothetical protein
MANQLAPIRSRTSLDQARALTPATRASGSDAAGIKDVEGLLATEPAQAR